MITSILQIVTALAAVIGLIVVAGILGKRRQKGSSFINVLEYRSFGPKKGLSVVKVGSNVLLLAVSQNDFKLLGTYHANELEYQEKSGVLEMKSLSDITGRQ